MDTPFPTLSFDLLDAQPAPAGAAPTLPSASTPALPAISTPALPSVSKPTRPTASEPDLPALQTVSSASTAPSPSPSPSQSPAAALRDTLAIALDLAPQVIDNLVGRAMLGIDRQATAHPDAAQRALLDTSAAAMDGYRRRWVKQFAVLLRVAFAHPPAAGITLPQADLRICASEMAELERLVIAAGSQRGNPFEPQNYVRALIELLSRSEAQPEQRQVWMHFLLGALGTQLAWMYLQLAASLRSPGSRDVMLGSEPRDFADYSDYVFGLGGKAPPEMPAQPVAKPAMTPEMRALAEEASRTVRQLRGVLGMPEPDVSALPDDEMARMMQDIEESERLMMEVSKRGLTLPDPKAEEKQIDHIARAVERLINDYRNATTGALVRVPQAARDAMERMQQPLEKLAASDASLLTQADHPARQLLEAVSKRCLLIASEAAESFANFFAPVEKMLDAVAHVAQPSAKVYEQALARLQPVWLQQEEELKKLQDSKEINLAQLEVRKQLASRLAFGLVSRRDASDAPVPIKQFLMGPWAQVLARAQLHPQHPQDEERYEYAVALLLWSVSVRRAGAHAAQLIQRVPDLFAVLRSGLASVVHPQGDVDAFLVELKKLHEVVLASDAPTSDADDTFPPEPPTSEDISDMMQLGAMSEPVRSPPPAAPSYQSDLNLL